MDELLEVKMAIDITLHTRNKQFKEQLEDAKCKYPYMFSKLKKAIETAIYSGKGSTQITFENEEECHWASYILMIKGYRVDQISENDFTIEIKWF